MLTSVWIAQENSTCAYQVMFHPDDAKSPHDNFATVTVFKPECMCEPHVYRADDCAHTDAELVSLAQRAFAREDQRNACDS